MQNLSCIGKDQTIGKSSQFEPKIKDYNNPTTLWALELNYS